MDWFLQYLDLSHERVNHKKDLNFKVIVVGSLNREFVKIKWESAEQKWLTNGVMVIAVFPVGVKICKCSQIFTLNGILVLPW